MIIKSIKLKNFRQFIDEEIHFSCDPEKNITLVIADNAVGKTTIANAFTWCLFGQVNFENTTLLNRNIANSINKLWTTEEVEVVVELKYADRHYSIRTNQIYKRIERGFQKEPLTRTISYKDSSTGVTVMVDDKDVANTIKLIIPEDLSSYLFIKAEQINAMGLDIQNKTRSSDFSNAVKKILGLQALENAINHLNSAYDVFQKKYSSNADKNIQKAHNEIEDLKLEMKNTQNKIELQKSDITSLKNRVETLKDKIKEGEEGTKNQSLLDSKQSKLESSHRSLELQKGNFLKTFANKLPSYCYRIIVPEVINMLSNTEIADSNVPSVNSKTIKCLIKRGKCICQNDLSIGTDSHRALIDLLDHVPPKYIGSAVGEYIKEAQTRIASENITDLANEYSNYKIMENRIQSEIDFIEEEISELKQKLLNHKSTSDFVREQTKCEEEIQKRLRKVSELEVAMEQYKDKKLNAERKLMELAMANKQNQKIEKCKKYTKQFASTLENHYIKKEEELRQKLNDKINELFTSVFSNDYLVIIDNKYRISITDTLGEPQDIDTSGAQSISVVLSFITSVLKIAQEIHNMNLENSEEHEFLTTEPYPLVLDAPFSTFDTTRIELVSTKLPKLTEQIIIFSKDTEGYYIKKHISNFIGKYYTMEPKTLENNQQDVLVSNVIEGNINVN
jgi:DNA sulfur modification protein DndD